MRFLIIICFCINLIYACMLKEESWNDGESFLLFLQRHNITTQLYFGLDKTERELCSDIQAGTTIQVLYGDNSKKIKQILIPVNEDLQIHIYKNNGRFAVEVIPIESITRKQSIKINIITSPYKDILSATNNRFLAYEFARAFKKKLNFKQLKKGDYIVLDFSQKIKLGSYFGTPDIYAALVSEGGKKYYFFQYDKDSRYYDQRGRSLTRFFLKVPLRYTRISDRFTNKRWHPILKEYRAHLGIDFAAPRGRKIHAAADGVIIFKGRRGGYGNAIIIKHKDGYKSLYGHMEKFAHVRVGEWVRQGTLIGYVGSTGLSTGPHLHFGLYKYSRAINPAKVLRITKNHLEGRNLRKFLASVVLYKENLTKASKDKVLKLKNMKLSSKIKLAPLKRSLNDKQ